MRELIGILQLFAIRGVGILSLFLANVLIARHYGAASQGLFQSSLAWAVVGATFGRFGQEQLMLRTAAEMKSVEDETGLRQILRASLTGIIPLLVVTSLAAVFAQYWMPFETSEARLFQQIMIAAIIPTGILMVVTEALRGWQKVNAALAWQGSVPQALFLLGLVFLIISGTQGQTPVAAVYLAAYLFAAGISLWLWRAGAAEQHTVAASWIGVSGIFRRGFHFWLFALLTALIAWIDIIVLDIAAPPAVIGQYTAVIRTGAILGVFVQTATAGLIARLALLYAERKIPLFKQQMRRYLMAFAALAIPIALVLLAAPHTIMSLWGPEYAAHSGLLAVYGMAQVFNLVTAIFGLVVPVMSGERALAAIQVVHLIMKFLAVLIGYKLFGLSGAIWAASVVLVITNLLFAGLYYMQIRNVSRS